LGKKEANHEIFEKEAITMVRKPTALVIAGGWVDRPKEANRFVPQALHILNFLCNESGLSDARLIKVQEYTPSKLAKVVEHTVSTALGPLFLSYHGHGISTEWQYRSKAVFSYSRLAEILAKAKHEVTFVNSCCHAYAVVDQLEAHGVNPELVGLIAACAADKTITDWYHEKRLEYHWLDRKEHPRILIKKGHQRERFTKEDVARLGPPSILEWVPDEEQLVRWGAVWDHMFFAKKH
jgi:hypothetical protein